MWLKWAGVVYLIYLGVSSWRQGVEDLPETSASWKPLHALFWQGLLLATINPKTLLFNAAFLPQFVSKDAGSASLLAAAAIYLSRFIHEVGFVSGFRAGSPGFAGCG